MQTTVLPKKSNESITFRIPSDKLDQLDKVSQEKSISLNTLFNQITKAYLDWHSVAASAKLYYLPRSFLIRLIDELNEEELNELAKDTAKKDLVNISLFLKGNFTLATISDITETWLKIAQMPYRYEITSDECKIIIEHDMGLKYSQLIKGISTYLLEAAFEVKSSYYVTENSVIIRIADSI
ncbi:MAG TPA: hypothetical protein VE130_14785 [Nitrososphaeraceae archaeon]|jgi:hypothetical protein|nr:hypothetical protein [Nitrososphaeraceae archaeon]